MNLNSPRSRTVRLSLLALALGGGIAALALAGPLDPPAGPVTPTYKTLTEVEPRIAINATNTPGDANSVFKITQPGSYYLTGNITGVVGKHGIEIVVSGVTLDLKGFELIGIAGMGTFDGVSATENFLTNIAVVTGSVRNWGGDGVDLGLQGAANCRIEGILAGGNAGFGISVGPGCTIANCSVKSNTNNGIATGADCTISGCSAFQNSGSGIVTGSGGSVSNCSAHSNTGNGINTGNGSSLAACTATTNGGAGILANLGSTLSNCSAEGNSGIGINTGTGCTLINCSTAAGQSSGIAAGTASTLTNCSAFANAGIGINTGNSCTFTGCSAISNTAGGLTAGTGCTVTNCTANSNTTIGIFPGAGSTVSNCTANSNTTVGISVGGNSSVTDCTVQSNTLDGILCSLRCVIRGNTCAANGNGAGDGANIHATFIQNRIEGNTCTSADRGIDVDNFGNIIIRNTCSGNTTNWTIVSDNVVGPILDRTAPASGFISGNSAPDSTGSTHPNANFTY